MKSKCREFVFSVPADLPVLLEHLHTVEWNIMRIQEHVNSTLHQPQEPIFIQHSELSLRLCFH